MPCEIHYLIDHRVILTRLYGDLSREDSEIFNRQNVDLLTRGASQVHIIFDTTQLQHINLNIREMLSLMSFTHEPHLGWVFIVGGSPMAKFMGTLVLEAGGVNYRFVNTMDDALATLRRFEPDLLFDQP